MPYHQGLIEKALALALATAVMFIIPRTDMEGVSTWTELARPTMIGPQDTPFPNALNML